MSKTKFFLHKVFYGKHRLTISNADLARIYEISEEEVRSYVNHDVEAGLCIEDRAHSTYYLTFLGLRALYHEMESSLQGKGDYVGCL